MTTKTLDLSNIERKIFWALASLLGLVAVFYLYSVLTLTVAVVDRNNMNRAAHELAVTSGTLEAEYLTQANTITLAYAEDLGFKEVSKKFAGETFGTKLSMAR